MKLINIGFGNLVSAGRVVAVVSPDSAPVKRLVKDYETVKNSNSIMVSFFNAINFQRIY